MLFVLSFSTNPAYVQNTESRPPFNIGVVFDGPWEQNEKILNLFEREILELTRKEYNVAFPLKKQIICDWQLENIKSAIDQMLADPDIHLVLTMGVIASYEAANRDKLIKPVIAPIVIDAELQQLPLKDGGSGRKNLNYVTYPTSLQRDITYFLEIVPFENLIILSNERYKDALVPYHTSSMEILKSMGINATEIHVGKSIVDALNQIPADAQAVYVTPLIQLSSDDFDQLVQELIKRNLPSFSLFGKSEVEKGIMASVNPDIFPRLARRVALNVQRILLGEEPGTIPVAFAAGEQLTINMATARAIRVYPGWGILTEAELISQTRQETGRALDLKKVVHEAVRVNLDLITQIDLFQADNKNVSLAKSHLLPQINLSALGSVIDSDRAEASFGQQAERTITGSITATQLLYSEQAWANLSIQNKLKISRENELEQIRLDITQNAATTFLNLLKAKTFERIQKENLKRTRSNLELARIREVIGSAGPAEVYRWESEIASNRKTVIEANSLRNIAEIELNRILHRPLEEHFFTIESDLQNPDLWSSDGVFYRYMGNQETFRALRIFLVQEGMNASPELAALDAAISAQERLLYSRKSAYWSPTLALQAEASKRFLKEGAGSENSLDFSQLPIAFEFPQVDDNNWSIGLNLSIPLFRGGARYAEHQQASLELSSLHTQRQALAERIEQRIRSSLHKAGASLAGINQAGKSAEAAEKSLEVVSDAYSRGVLSIIDLLDAQNAALVADLSAANAIYDFLIDFMAVERSIGSFHYFLTDEQEAKFLERLDNFFIQSGIPLKK